MNAAKAKIILKERVIINYNRLKHLLRIKDDPKNNGAPSSLIKIGHLGVKTPENYENPKTFQEREERASEEYQLREVEKANMKVNNPVNA